MATESVTSTRPPTPGAHEWLIDARLQSGERVDVLVDHSGPISRIVEIVTDGRVDQARASRIADPQPEVRRTDLDGWLLLPAPSEPHTHLDKAYLAEMVPNPSGDLAGAIEAMQTSVRLRTPAETVERAERAARRFAENGFVRIRSHVDVSAEEGLAGATALCEVRRRVADLIDIELVALPGIGFSEPSGASTLSALRDGLDMGIDLVGGCPHLEPSSAAATDMLLELATERGIGVDLHTDENLDPSATGLDELVAAVEAGFDLPVTASHCVAAGQRDGAQQMELAERVADADIAVITLPLTNLYLQGRARHPMPRAMTAVGALLAAGATVAAGSDNLQDPFNPIGRACPFDTAGLMMLTAHLLPDQAWSAVSTSAAAAIGQTAGIEVGQPADLLAVDARTMREAIAEAPTRRRWRARHATA